MNFIDHDQNSAVGVLKFSKDINNALLEKHPAVRDAAENVLIDIEDDPPLVQPVLFEDIDAELLHKAVKNLKGSGGPTLVDSEGWRHILMSKAYGNQSVQLCQTIADMTKRLCIEEIDPDYLKEFISCRLIPLDKNPDVQPIGIGEVLRRISGNLVT